MEAISTQVKPKRERKSWAKEEELALIDCLEEVVAKGKRCDAGTFKPGTLKQIEEVLAGKFPNANIKVKPHIESALRRLKNDYHILYDMINKSGFGWDDEKKCIHVDSDEVWNTYIKQFPEATRYKDKSFPLYDKLAYIFGKDRANGKAAEAPGDVVEDLEKEETIELMKDSDDDIMDITNSMSVNQTPSSNNKSLRDSYVRSRKRSRSTDQLAASITSFGKDMASALQETSTLFGEVGASVKVVKEFYEDSRKVPSELQKMKELSPRDRVMAAQKIMQNTQLVHLFWGFDEEHRLEMIKALFES